jgi:hypothetical protein
MADTVCVIAALEVGWDSTSAFVTVTA